MAFGSIIDEVNLILKIPYYYYSGVYGRGGGSLRKVAIKGKMEKKEGGKGQKNEERRKKEEEEEEKKEEKERKREGKKIMEILKN